MIQELFCGGGEGGLLMEGKKISKPSNVLLPVKTTTITTTTTPSPSSTTTTTSTTNNNNHPPNSHTTTTTSTATSEPQQQNLRCPRCDSSNTKFCYYNNYNLTQPRHFCKTCRRYWTKGGALRNVPIGGGCRKAKPSPSSLSSKFPPAPNKPRTPPTTMAAPLVESTVLAKLNTLRGVTFHPDLHHWPSHTSNLMALLGSTRNPSHVSSLLPLPNPNPNPNPNRVIKVEESSLMSPSYLVPNSTTTAAIASDHHPQQLLNDPFSSMWKNSSAGQYHQLLLQQQQQQQQGPVAGEAPINSGIHDLYQKLRWTNDYQNVAADNGVGNLGCSSTIPASLGVCSTTTSTGPVASLLEPIPISGAGDGCWNNSPFSWSDHMPPANGAFAAFP